MTVLAYDSYKQHTQLSRDVSSSDVDSYEFLKFRTLSTGEIAPSPMAVEQTTYNLRLCFDGRYC